MNVEKLVAPDNKQHFFNRTKYISSHRKPGTVRVFLYKKRGLCRPSFLSFAVIFFYFWLLMAFLI